MSKLRRTLKASWTAKKTNESVFRRWTQNLKSTKSGHNQPNLLAMSRVDILTTEKMNGKRARGGQREKIWEGLGRWTGESKGIDLLVKSEDRKTWRDVVTNPNRHGTP